MLELRGRSYVNGEPICVTIEAGRIARVEPAWPEADAAAWPWIAPGLFDLQINGHKGIWFCDPKLTAEQVLNVLEAHFAFGITRMCPTLITASFEALAAGIKAIREACESTPWADRMVPGIHLEGPHISPEDGPRGAHPLSQVRPANWDEFRRLQDISGNRIRLVTLAPETGNAAEFIRQAVASGVTVSIGHTGATPEQVTAAIDAGATLSTHLGNGARDDPPAPELHLGTTRRQTAVRLHHHRWASPAGQRYPIGGACQIDAAHDHHLRLRRLGGVSAGTISDRIGRRRNSAGRQNRRRHEPAVFGGFGSTDQRLCRLRHSSRWALAARCLEHGQPEYRTGFESRRTATSSRLTS